MAQVQCPVLLLNGTEDLQVSARQNMSPMLKALHRAHRQATATRLEGVNHLFQPELEEWPVVDGAQQPTFSLEALKNIHEWWRSKPSCPGPHYP
ncbi:hypothetical protein [Hymenobacter coccineus]|uniref:Peptidase S9 prolyl oligopeptidase catalytic domain-containing protein n=1 Tax=Hymenobacter coccineus TaxID=1908235 RepID=A0A1G1TJS9_9BACT|nr:hypothetical protein [Hymenobacter coccineus]OGX91141.1 hypothetical protein BEN49_20885 [Hymenobacter coccineus]